MNDKKYSEQFKIEMVNLYNNDRPVKDILKDYNISRGSLYNWIRKYSETKTSRGKNKNADQDNENKGNNNENIHNDSIIRRLKDYIDELKIKNQKLSHENEKLKKEKEVLKNAALILWKDNE
jgi:transposase-like protein